MFGFIRFISDRFKKTAAIGWRDYTCFRILTTYFHWCWLRSGTNSGLLPFLPVSPESNVSLPPFGKVDPVLARPARKPVVHHRRPRLHGKELSAVLATIRHVLSFSPGFPVPLPHFGQMIGSFAPSGPRHPQCSVISLCEKV